MKALVNTSTSSNGPDRHGAASRQTGAARRRATTVHDTTLTSGGARTSDRVFLGLSTGAAGMIMVILAGVALFLIIQAIPAITADWQATSLAQGVTQGYDSFWSYVGPLVWGTLWSAFLALIIATPISIGIALFISHYAPRRLAGSLGYLVDLLAAVPSIVFGLWGIIVIRPLLIPMSDWLNAHMGWFPLFSGAVTSTGSTMLAGAVVLAVMVIPIITSITREIFLQTPPLQEQAALALGATKWEMIRLAVFPHARSGMISAILLGLGRALGETMAVAMIISPNLVYSLRILTDGENSQTIAANIALNFPIADDLQRRALIGTGLLLFAVSLAVNIIARLIATGELSRRIAARRRRRTTVEETA
ncbi:phosphate ABC transporter permease subunit PstC [Pseudoclavibacter caeni]